MLTLADIPAPSVTVQGPRKLRELAVGHLDELKRIVEMMDNDYELSLAMGRDLQKQLDARRSAGKGWGES
jgi:hypothetical protein